MFIIVSVNTPMLQQQARFLFQLYGEFLRETQSCGFFSHDKFLDEIATLPAPYTDAHGNVLLAMRGRAACACVAYRATVDAATCEIKRLFVSPEARGNGVARALIMDVLQRVREHGFTRVILDTDLDHMPGAEHLYLSFGFREYGAREGSIAFYELSLQ